MALTSKLSAIADAIRAKTGKAGKLTLDQMPTEIAGIETGGGIDPESLFPFGGLNAEKVAEYDETFTLADTSFVVGSTSSTTATTIKATVSNRFTSPTIAIGDKDVVVVQTLTVVPEYGSGAENKAKSVQYVNCYLTYIAKRRSSMTVTATQGTRTALSASTAWIRYFSPSGSETYSSSSYGMYGTPSSASVSSSSSANASIRCSSPVLYARANTSYASAANQKAITDCAWYWHVDVYLVDKFSTAANAMFNNCLNILFPPTMSLGLDDGGEEPVDGEE